MKKGMLLFSVFAALQTCLYAQLPQPVTISGQVSTDKDSVELLVWFGKDPIVGAGDESKKIPVPVGKDGKFSFTTPAINHVARLSIQDGFTGNQLFTQEQQFVAPGDKIQLFANIHDQGNPYYFKAVFFGKGSSKYECIQALKTISSGYPHKYRGYEYIVHTYDSLLDHKMKTLNNFKGRMSPDEYALIQTDFTGELRMNAIVAAFGYYFGAYNNPLPDTLQLTAKKKIFDDLINHFRDSIDITNSIPLSVNYRNYEYQKTKTALALHNNGEPVTMKQVCDMINDAYSGLLREKLLAAALLRDFEIYFFFGEVDPDDYANCLRQAIGITKTPDIKTRLQQMLDTRAKGAVAYNFTLPVDSSTTKTISLANLKGKVILLDLWSYQCTGCMKFTQTFHKKIYPQLKDNSDFAVVSIMLGESSKDAYMRRLRSEGGAIYTYPDYINLFGGRGVRSARELELRLGISAYPTIILLDKQGRIYSSTLPVIYGDTRKMDLDQNIQKLTGLIKKALAEPGSPKYTVK